MRLEYRPKILERVVASCSINEKKMTILLSGCALLNFNKPTKERSISDI